MRVVARSARAGVTMIELLIALLLLSLLMLAVFQILDRSLSLWRKTETRRSLLEEACAVTDLMSHDLRGLEGGERGDLLVEWLTFDTDGDGIAETKWPRFRLVRQASAADAARIAQGDEPAPAATAPAASANAGDEPIQPARARPALAEVLWMIVPASLTDRNARAEGVIWRGERLVGDAATKSFFAPDFFGTSNRPPAGATDEVTGGCLWMGVLLATQTSVVHDGWKLGPGMDSAATSWDAWSRGRPDVEIHPWNEPAPGMPKARERPLLPRRVRVELEFERPIDRDRRTRLVEPVDVADSAIGVDDPDKVPRGEGDFVLVDAEWMRVTSVAGRSVTVERAQRGTRAVIHSVGAMVHWGLRLERELPVSTYREDWRL